MRVASWPTVQRRNNRRRLSGGTICPVNPRGSRAARSQVGSARLILRSRRSGRTGAARQPPLAVAGQGAEEPLGVVHVG